jgi:hypothetical protein
VEYEVRPEPTPDELEALLLALEEDAAAAASAYRSAWREAGLAEPEDE